MRKRSIISKILTAIRKANSDYEKWSGGDWLGDCGSEAFQVTYILKNVTGNIRKDNPNAYITMEEPFASICEYAGANPKRGRPSKFMRGNSRADIVIWETSERPYGVIEAKRKWTNDPCLHDLKRLQTLMDCNGVKRGGSLRFCCLAAFLYRGNDPEGHQLLKYYKQVREKIGSSCRRKHRVKFDKPYKTSYPGNEGYTAGGLVVEFYR